MIVFMICAFLQVRIHFHVFTFNGARIAGGSDTDADK